MVKPHIKDNTREHFGQNVALFRDLRRSDTFLIRNARLFPGDGPVMETGSVLVRGGKIVEVFEGAGPDPESLKAEVVEGAGKTLLPGLIDVHVHLGAPAGWAASGGDYDARKSIPPAAAALLYSGVTAARSVGDGIDSARALRAQIADGSKLGAGCFYAALCSPPRKGTARSSSSTSLPRCATPRASKSSARPKLRKKPAGKCAS